MELLGLGIADRIPAAKAVCLFRDNLAKHGLVKKVFAHKVFAHIVEVGQIVTEYSSRKSRSKESENP